MTPPSAPTPVLNGWRVGRLGRRVVGSTDRAEARRDGGDIHHLAEALDAFGCLLFGGLTQMRGGSAADPEWDHGVDVEHGLELLVRHFVDELVPEVAGGVHHDVQPPERVDGVLDQPVRWILDVGGRSSRTSADA